MKKNLFLLLLSLIFCSCRPDSDPIVVDARSFTGITIGNGVVVDSILKYDTAYYEIGTLVCNSDTVFQFKYTSLLSIDHQFEAYFIPSSSFGNYIDLFTSSFSISPILVWRNPQEFMSVVASVEPNKVYSPSYDIEIFDIYCKQDTKNWDYIVTTDAPEKIYYSYDWESRIHYDYMRYNADSAVLTISGVNLSVNDTIFPIDSLRVTLPSNVTKMANHFPAEIKDTISIIEDTTYTYSISGFMKGQKCGGDTCYIRVHKNEIISKQDESHHHQGQIYEYDE